MAAQTDLCLKENSVLPQDVVAFKKEKKKTIHADIFFLQVKQSSGSMMNIQIHSLSFQTSDFASAGSEAIELKKSLGEAQSISLTLSDTHRLSHRLSQVSRLRFFSDSGLKSEVHLFRFRIWSESQSKPSTSPEPLTAHDACTDHCRHTKGKH